MTSTVESVPSDPPAGRVPGQVCDRCRRLDAMVKTMIALPAFKQALSAFYEAEGIEQRRQTPPGHSQHPAEALTPISQNVVPSQSITLQQTGQALTLPVITNTPGPSSTMTRTQPVTIKSANEPVIGHMGRLVADDRQASMFGGSTTGVHFISQAEQQLQLLQMHKDAFPSCAYGLYLHSPWGSSVQNPLTPAVSDLAQQLPPNTVEIIEATINRWTPLYPIVHKSSTIDAMQRLLGFYETTSSGIIILYQILGLLALGTIGQRGDCTQQHHHFLCQSERFYTMATALLDRVIDQPSLQSLQGLVIMQIYLQVSGRYSTASHISGVATRLAQTLGLHRHSHRFKFDPLETELRRRAWWCQYSLDAFSSAYHGMPRLIRDQDVDTDLPTSVDHDLLSRTHVEFPLPGERSQVDTAISLFKLARIIGRTLEDLYTTTRRRGGVSKIAHLQAELNMWERVVLEPEMDPELATPVVNMSLEAIFLRVAHCVATIHVHRPALSFTVADAQFVPSLKACGQASATLVRLLSAGLAMMGADSQGAEYPANDWPESLLVTLLYPNGIHMLWQSGLTILFAGWKGYPVTVDQDESLIQSCIEALRQLHTHTDDVGNHVAQCAEVLDLLRKKIFSDLQVQPDLEQLQWNVWDWPMASALELANMLDTAPLDLDLDPERWL
ncbi:Fungal-trans domain-containing protein [Fusarium sp. Ph1]|nr:Fungal-trans domain-containing protein [Fusarium sp. Ph1]